MGYIYLWKNKVNGKEYIGQTKRDNINSRKSEYLYKIRKNEPVQIIHKAMLKYGIDNFSFEVLHEVSTEELNMKEIEEIQNRNTLTPNGYNREKGGKNSSIHEETRKLMSLSQSGEKHWNFGKKASEETRKLQSESRIGYVHSEETKQKISEGNKKPHNVSDKMRAAFENQKGKSRTEESIEKQRETMLKNDRTGSKCYISKKVDKYTLENVYLQTFDTIQLAAENAGVSATSIGNCCKQKIKKSAGFIWKFN